MEPIVSLQNFTAGFSGTTVLDNISLDIYPGELTVIVGHSGSGKSTLLRSINRLNDLYEDYFHSGLLKVRQNEKIEDVYSDSVNVTSLRRQMAMVFQTPNVLPVSIRKNFTLPLGLTTGHTREEIEDIIKSALEDVNLYDEIGGRLNENATRLSGGQQQRLCLARALALNPHTLLLDEPTSSLDFKASGKIEELLMKFKHRFTVIAVSHSLSQTRRIADRCLIMREGRIAADLKRDQLIEIDQFQKLVEDAF